MGEAPCCFDSDHVTCHATMRPACMHARVYGAEMGEIARCNVHMCAALLLCVGSISWSRQRQVSPTLRQVTKSDVPSCVPWIMRHYSCIMGVGVRMHTSCPNATASSSRPRRMSSTNCWQLTCKPTASCKSSAAVPPLPPDISPDSGHDSAAS